MSKPICDKCGNEETLFTSVDAWACLTCDEWKEMKCGYDSCEFCPGRTDKPSQMTSRFKK